MTPLHDAHQKYIANNCAKELATGKVHFVKPREVATLDYPHIESWIEGIGLVRSTIKPDPTGKQVVTHSLRLWDPPDKDAFIRDHTAPGWPPARSQEVPTGTARYDGQPLPDATRPMSGTEKEVQHMAEGEQLYATKKVPEKCNWESDALSKAQLSAEQKLRKELLTLLIESGTGVDNAIVYLPRLEKLIRTGTDSQ